MAAPAGAVAAGEEGRRDEAEDEEVQEVWGEEGGERVVEVGAGV